MSPKSRSNKSVSVAGLRRKRGRIVREIEKVTDLVRGSLTEQYLTRTNANGRKYQAGPYYVRTWYIDKQKHTARVPVEQVPKVEKQIRNYQKLKSLFDQLVEVTEQLSERRKDD